MGNFASTPSAPPGSPVVVTAGVAEGGYVEITSVEAMEKVFQVNTFGAVRMTRWFLPLRKFSKSHPNGPQARIIMATSAAGRVAMPGMSACAGSKSQGTKPPMMDPQIVVDTIMSQVTAAHPAERTVAGSVPEKAVLWAFENISDRIKKFMYYPKGTSSVYILLGEALEEVVQHFPCLVELEVLSFHDVGTGLSGVKPKGVYPHVHRLHVFVNVADFQLWTTAGESFARAVATHLPGIVDVHLTVTAGGESSVDELASAWMNIAKTLPAKHLWFDLEQCSELGAEAFRKAPKRVRREIDGKFMNFDRSYVGM
ncbi:hypothetical protein M427DRAFT_30752 [Gonapodya prolifera JEL478]|uniref:Uncharacterized protein n=1 Tax=Gonapodya prolifera (strain JEL478) TaxID=1344416 RepID=A0A139AJF2_GONPJ|nr:hypothetical protein M427DRAFT_30752 [Gonapodya prolifera JEL478]|eukprot:KXS16917.1 hypothetical protein M427DRAFT_30752 [Gonapodya prolifera JEL478]